MNEAHRWRAAHVGRLVAALLLAAPAFARAQNIIQAHVLDLSVLEVQVIVNGAGVRDQIQCLLRDAAGRVRVAGSQRVGSGAASGRSTVVSIPLAVLNPQEREYAVTLVRGDRELARTDWRPLFPAP